jgi:uncharacterized protein YggU (UPF0235/DUF167 family)
VSVARIAVRLRPRAGRDELVEMRDGVLVARVSAPPIEGRANDALCRLIAKTLGIAPSRVTVIRGERSREKLVEVQGIDGAALEDVLRRKA